RPRHQHRQQIVHRLHCPRRNPKNECGQRQHDANNQKIVDCRGAATTLSPASQCPPWDRFSTRFWLVESTKTETSHVHSASVNLIIFSKPTCRASLQKLGFSPVGFKTDCNRPSRDRPPISTANKSAV